LQRWVIGYKEILKPKLLIGTYQKFKKEIVVNFAELQIDTWQGNWGREPAAALYKKYLVPQVLTMYVPPTKKAG
jgi:hypothetical protein